MPSSTSNSKDSLPFSLQSQSECAAVVNNWNSQVPQGVHLFYLVTPIDSVLSS